jgi:hypothetical protein
MFRSIALGGGGVRGGLMIGGLSALQKYQTLEFPDGIYGCSAGALIATAIAYKIPLSAIKHMFETEFNLSTILPSINLTSISSFTQEKGLFSMDAFTNTILKAFDSQGIDLRNAVIADSPQKLFILASNLTTRKSTWLTGSVPIMDALRCSSCLPFVFHPQLLYNNLYIDGGFHTHAIHEVVPADCLVFHISRSELAIPPERLKKMTLGEYSATLYESFRSKPLRDNVVCFKNDTISLMQELTPEQKKLLFTQGFEQASRFFTKRFPEKLS